MTDSRPPSPCVTVCSLDQYDVCVGCYRTLDEIAAWAGMSADQQWDVVADLAHRGSRDDGTG